MNYSVVGTMSYQGFLKRLKRLFFPEKCVFTFKLNSDEKYYWASNLRGIDSLMVTALSEFTTKDEKDE